MTTSHGSTGTDGPGFDGPGFDETAAKPRGDAVSFGARLDAAVAARGPLCVGIDPHAALLTAWGLPASAAGLERFALTCVEALAGEVAVLKPQSAFFEVFGSAGIAVLERTIAAARAAGALVLADVKRGDIGSTMTAYASAYLDPSAPLAVDAITVSPFLGVGSLQPAFDAALANAAGLFVLACTSNPEAPQVQSARASDGRTVTQVIVDDIAARNAGATPPGSPGSLGSFGVVVGATIGDTGTDFSALNGPILAPGVGAQGGTAADVRRLFGAAPNSGAAGGSGPAACVLPSVSRDVLRAGPDVAALREAARRYQHQFAS